MGEVVPAEIEAYAVEHSMEESELCRELRAEPIGTWSFRRCWWVPWKGPC